MSYVVSGNGVYVAHCPAGGSWDTDRTQVDASGYRARVMKHSDGALPLCLSQTHGRDLRLWTFFVTTSTDRANWSEPLRLTTNLKLARSVRGRDAGRRLHGLLRQNTRARPTICIAGKSDDAVAWDPEERITSDAVNNTQPHFIMNGDDICLVWAHAVDYPRRS